MPVGAVNTANNGERITADGEVDRRMSGRLGQSQWKVVEVVRYGGEPELGVGIEPPARLPRSAEVMDPAHAGIQGHHKSRIVEARVRISTIVPIAECFFFFEPSPISRSDRQRCLPKPRHP